MISIISRSHLEILLLTVSYTVTLLVILNCRVQASPAASVDFFLAANKLDKVDPTVTNHDYPPPAAAPKNGETLAAAESSFHQFINSKPSSLSPPAPSSSSSAASEESTIIGEIKPNASALELMSLKNKIAETILRMQEADKQRSLLVSGPPLLVDREAIGKAECFIEITRVEKIPGKCHKSSIGVPICQSDNYISINNDCN